MSKKPKSPITGMPTTRELREEIGKAMTALAGSHLIDAVKTGEIKAWAFVMETSDGVITRHGGSVTYNELCGLLALSMHAYMAERAKVMRPFLDAEIESKNE